MGGREGGSAPDNFSALTRNGSQPPHPGKQLTSLFVLEKVAGATIFFWGGVGIFFVALCAPPTLAVLL